MSNLSEQMRLFMALTEDEYTGPRQSDPNVEYSSKKTKGEITQVIATLSSHESGKYTKMGRNLKRIEWLSAKIDQLKQNVKQETREKIADLFHAEDACRTRVIETVSFTFKMTKDPEASTSIKYAKVLDELQDHLTPELLVIMEGLKAKYSSVVEKEPALIKVQDKKQTEESFDAALDEGVLDSLKSFFHKYLQKVLDWGNKYDAKLAKLESMVSMGEAIEEQEITEMFGHPHEDVVDALIEVSTNLGKALGGQISADQIETWKQRVEAQKKIVMKFLQDD